MKIRNRIRSWLVGQGERFTKEDFGVEMSEIRDKDHFWQLYRAWRRLDSGAILSSYSFGLRLGL